MQRIYGDLVGPYPASTGGSRFCMMLVDDYTNSGWPLFLKDKSGPMVQQAFKAWGVSVKPLQAIHGRVEVLLTDNFNEFVNSAFQAASVELGIKVELTPAYGAKRNGCVERSFALVAEGARAAWLEYPLLFPGIEYPARARSWNAMWAEGFTWMSDSINITAQVSDKPLMMCPTVKLFGKRPSQLILPFTMPGYRHRNRQHKMQSKGERCFYLNTGNNHSSATHKIILPSGQVSFSVDVTCGYHRAPFVGEVPTWGGGAVCTNFPTTSGKGPSGGTTAATATAVAGSSSAHRDLSAVTTTAANAPSGT